MRDANQMCVLCDEAITNPICLGCLEKEMVQWADSVNKDLARHMRMTTGVFRSYSHEGTKCVVCGGSINICSHCFCKDVYEWIKKEHPEDAESFLTSFNYEIESPCKF